MHLLVVMFCAHLCATAVESSTAKSQPITSQRRNRSAPPGGLVEERHHASGDTATDPLPTLQKTSSQRSRSAPAELSVGTTSGPDKRSPRNRASTPVECDDSGYPRASAHREAADDQHTPESYSPVHGIFRQGQASSGDQEDDWQAHWTQKSVPRRKMFCVGSSESSSEDEDVAESLARLAQDDAYRRRPVHTFASSTSADYYRTPFQPRVPFLSAFDNMNPRLLLGQEIIHDPQHQEALADHVHHQLSISTSTEHEQGSEHGTNIMADVDEEQDENVGEDVPLLGERKKTRCPCCNIL